MDQNSNHITIEMKFRLQMICGARHNICYGKRWIMWSVLILRLIPVLWHAIAPHNSSKAVEPTEQVVVHGKSPILPSGSGY